MREITVAPAHIIGYGYVVRMPLADWRNICDVMADAYVTEAVEDYADPVDETDNPTIGLHMDESQLADLWSTITAIDFSSQEGRL